MHWLRYGTLVLCLAVGLAVLVLVIHSFWLATPLNDPTVLGQKVQDLQVIVIILLALAGLYTVVFLLAPSMSDRILKQQAEQTVTAVRDQLSANAQELRELKEEIRQMMSGRVKPLGDLMSAPAARLDASQPGNGDSGQEHLRLTGRLRVLNDELVQIYQALAASCIPHDLSSAKTHLNQALNLTGDSGTAANLHYDLACVLARQGELGEAVIEIQTALLDKSPELGRRLAKDTEEGGPLYELATKQPYDRVLDDLLMDVSVGP